MTHAHTRSPLRRLLVPAIKPPYGRRRTLARVRQARSEVVRPATAGTRRPEKAASLPAKRFA